MGNTINLYSNTAETTAHTTDETSVCHLPPLESGHSQSVGSRNYNHIDTHYTDMLKTKPMDKRKRRPSRHN